MAQARSQNQILWQTERGPVLGGGGGGGLKCCVEPSHTENAGSVEEDRKITVHVYK